MLSVNSDSVTSFFPIQMPFSTHAKVSQCNFFTYNPGTFPTAVSVQELGARAFVHEPFKSRVLVFYSLFAVFFQARYYEDSSSQCRSPELVSLVWAQTPHPQGRAPWFLQHSHLWVLTRPCLYPCTHCNVASFFNIIIF